MSMSACFVLCVPSNMPRCVCADGGVLYICGVPGTGKTALVMEMLRTLRPQALQAGAQVVAINCLQLPTPQHVFSRLWEKLSGQHLGPARWVRAARAATHSSLRMPQRCFQSACTLRWHHGAVEAVEFSYRE